MAVFGQNNILRIPLERFPRFHRIARSSHDHLSFTYSNRARRAVSTGTAPVAWRSLCAEIRSTLQRLQKSSYNRSIFES